MRYGFNFSALLFNSSALLLASASTLSCSADGSSDSVAAAETGTGAGAESSGTPSATPVPAGTPVATTPATKRPTAGNLGSAPYRRNCNHTIGDSWIQLPGNQVTHLEELMREAGSIGAGESFDRREVSGTTLSTIIASYNRDTDCKILIMDGGGIDLFSTPAGDQAAIDPIVQQFEDFLEKVAADGNVQHIIYSLYPVIPSTPNLNQNMKPGFSAACAASAVDCHLVDLEPLFQGQHFAGDQTHANEDGGFIIAEAWWQAMQENCIAQ